METILRKNHLVIQFNKYKTLRAKCTPTHQNATPESPTFRKPYQTCILSEFKMHVCVSQYHIKLLTKFDKNALKNKRYRLCQFFVFRNIKAEYASLVQEGIKEVCCDEIANTNKATEAKGVKPFYLFLIRITLGTRLQVCC